MMHVPSHSRAFSLVELSIVLVILGLLVGGILAGQSLIRAAELRSITNDFQRFVTATHAFRNKYHALPGDLSNATAFWGFQSGTGCVNSTSAATNTSGGACDGNLNGIINDSGGASTANEAFQFWRQLALAGLIEGSYTGITYTYAHSLASYPGINVPPGRLSNSGWTAFNRTLAQASSDAQRLIVEYGNLFIFGVANSYSDTSNPVITPAEAWNIDLKMDDGHPAQGRIIVRNWSACTTVNSGTASASNLDVRYKLDEPSIQCALFFRQVF